jgi:hypothetical protein
MTRQSATLALCAALIAVAAAELALARPTHRCVARVPNGCPNQHPVRIVHGQTVVFHPPLITGVQGGGARGGGRRGHGKSPKIGSITVTKRTDSSSPTLFQRTQ